MALQQVTNHVAATLALLAQQFKGTPNLAALVTVFCDELQELENALFEVLNERTLETAAGAQLDGIGAIVGEPRRGREDDEYRLHIRARIRLNISSGTGPDIIDILAFVLDGRTIEQVDYYPAAFVVEVHGATPDNEGTEAAAIMKSGTAAGVGSQLVFSSEDDATSFIWGSDSEEASSTQGWSTDAADDVEGGVLSQVYDGE